MQYTQPSHTADWLAARFRRCGDFAAAWRVASISSSLLTQLGLSLIVFQPRRTQDPTPPVLAQGRNQRARRAKADLLFQPLWLQTPGEGL